LDKSSNRWGEIERRFPVRKNIFHGTFLLAVLLMINSTAHAAVVLGSGLVGLVLWKRRRRVWLAVMVGLVSLNPGVVWAATIDIDEFQHATVLLPFAPQEGTLFLCENPSVPLSTITCEAPQSDAVVFLSDITTGTGSALLESDLPEPGEAAAPGDRALLIPFPAPFFSVAEPGGENMTQTLLYTPTIGQPGFALVQGMPVSYAISSDVVPEPVTCLLLGSGVVGLLLWRRYAPSEKVKS